MINTLVLFLIGFTAGIITRSAHLWWQNRHTDGQRRAAPMPNGRRVGAVLILAAMLWSMVTTQLTQNEIVALQRRSNDCYAQYYQAITVNRTLNEQVTGVDRNLDRLAEADRTSLRDYVIAIANLPPTLASLPPMHPDREQYKRDLLLGYIGKTDAVDRRRQQLQIERAKLEEKRKPYPEPTCGKA